MSMRCGAALLLATALAIVCSQNVRASELTVTDGLMATQAQEAEREIAQLEADLSAGDEEETAAEAEAEAEADLRAAEDEMAAVEEEAVLLTELHSARRKPRRSKPKPPPESPFGWKKFLKDRECACKILETTPSEKVSACHEYCRKLEGCNAVNFHRVTALCDLVACEAESSGRILYKRKKKTAVMCWHYVEPPAAQAPAAPPAPAPPAPHKT